MASSPWAAGPQEYRGRPPGDSVAPHHESGPGTLTHTGLATAVPTLGSGSYRGAPAVPPPAGPGPNPTARTRSPSPDPASGPGCSLPAAQRNPLPGAAPPPGGPGTSAPDPSVGPARQHRGLHEQGFCPHSRGTISTALYSARALHVTTPHHTTHAVRKHRRHPSRRRAHFLGGGHPHHVNSARFPKVIERCAFYTFPYI